MKKIIFILVLCLLSSAVVANSQSRKKSSQTTKTTKTSKSITTFTVNGVKFSMVYVEGGTFTMGYPDNSSKDFEWAKPAHKVTVSSFYIAQTEVTQGLWKAVMGSFPEEWEWEGSKRPVIFNGEEDWDLCQRFIRKLNQKTGMHFRLPTEAEWEYAARGGKNSKGYKYCGSNNIDEVAWIDTNSEEKSHDVATKLPNELELYDMSGNVGEWCSDWWGDYTSTPQTNPKGAAKSTNEHVVRGGDFYSGGGEVWDRGIFDEAIGTPVGLRLSM